MTIEQQTTITQIAEWLLESVSAEQLGALEDHLASACDETADELRRALGETETAR